MKLESIESLRVKEGDYGEIGGNLQIQNWASYLTRYEEIEERLGDVEDIAHLQQLL